MSDSRKLKKHLSSILATEKLANAMKTVAAAKFSTLSALCLAYTNYSDACGVLLQDFGGNAFSSAKCGNEKLYLLFTGNKGLCGGYNSELVSYFAETVNKSDKVIVCGRKGAELLAAKGYSAEYFDVQDVPKFENAEALLSKIKASYGDRGDIVLVYRRFENALKYPICTENLIPNGECGNAEPPLYLPDKQSITEPLATLCLTARLYGVMLQNATGAQAATLMTMRSAADNAKAEAAKAETALNRERQNALTASVIESASGMINDDF